MPFIAPPRDLSLAFRGWLADEIYPGLVGHPLDLEGTIAWIVDRWTAIWQANPAAEPSEKLQHAKNIVYVEIDAVVHGRPMPPWESAGGFVPPPRDLSVEMHEWLSGDIYPELVGHPLDPEGEIAWLVDRWPALYQTCPGSPTEKLQLAKEQIYREIEAVVHPPVPLPPPQPGDTPLRALEGQLQADGNHLRDAKGGITPLILHVGWILGMALYGEIERARTIIRRGRAAGYQVIRLFPTLGHFGPGAWAGAEVGPNDFTNNVGTRVRGQGSRYCEGLILLLQMCRDEGMKVDLSFGDLQRFGNADGVKAFFREVGDAIRGAGLVDVVAWVQVNEPWQNFPFSREMRRSLVLPTSSAEKEAMDRERHERMKARPKGVDIPLSETVSAGAKSRAADSGQANEVREALRELVNRLPGVLWGIGAAPSEEREDIVAWRAGVPLSIMHGLRDVSDEGSNAHRHVWGMGYENRDQFPMLQTEQLGWGTSVASWGRNGWNLGAIHMTAAMITGQAPSNVTSGGIWPRGREGWPDDPQDYPGFLEIPLFLSRIPASIREGDISTIVHGGRPEARLISVRGYYTPEHRVDGPRRCDQSFNDRELCDITHGVEGRRCDLVLRDFTEWEIWIPGQAVIAGKGGTLPTFREPAMVVARR